MFRIVGKLLHPIAQLRHMHAQVLRSLHIGHATLLDQAHSLKLELAGKLPSLHHPPPAPSKHLTRCLRNRVQATSSPELIKVYEKILSGVWSLKGYFDLVDYTIVHDGKRKVFRYILRLSDRADVSSSSTEIISPAHTRLHPK